MKQGVSPLYFKKKKKILYYRWLLTSSYSSQLTHCFIWLFVILISLCGVRVRIGAWLTMASNLLDNVLVRIRLLFSATFFWRKIHYYFLCSWYLFTFDFSKMSSARKMTPAYDSRTRVLLFLQKSHVYWLWCHPDPCKYRRCHWNWMLLLSVLVPLVPVDETATAALGNKGTKTKPEIAQV
jgi:hypothetical protein